MANDYRLRAKIVFISICVVFIFLAYQLFSIQVVHHSDYLSKQKHQFYHKEPILPKAGMILDRNGKILALSKTTYSVYVNPQIFKDNHKNVQALSSILDIPRTKIRRKVQSAKERDKKFIWIKRRVTEKESDTLRRKKIKGVGFRKEYKRSYPNNTLACHILGIRGIDEKALGGLESAYDKDLIGDEGERWVPRDAKMKKMASLELIEEPPRPGNDVYLTIDSIIQFIAENELDKACEQWKPVSAEVIVLRPSTGEILAIANRPSFDPNNPASSPVENHRNLIISSPYEPGSVFKPFIASALLQKGLAKTDETIFCENGSFKIGKRILHDHKPLGDLNFKDVIIKSSNIGMAKLGLRLGKENMYTNLLKFDFSKPADLGLPGEATGLISDFKKWDDYTLTSVPMGHEIALTSIQLIKAFNVFANNGVMVQPRLLHKISTPQGETLEKSRTMPIRQVVDIYTANEMKYILRSVVEKGTATRANIEDYTIAGKTGTAQVLNPDGTYSKTKFRGIFVGFGPVEKPQVIVLVMLNEPKGKYYGGTVAAPAVANIIQKTLKYLGVPAKINVATTE